MVKEAALWDWNGTLVTKEGIVNYIREHEPALYHQWWEIGTPEAKRAVKTEMEQVFEYASSNDLYPVEAMPQARERLQQDKEEGLTRIVLTTVQPESLERQARRLGLWDEIDIPLPLPQLLVDARLPRNTVKEDPIVYQAVAQWLRQRKFSGIAKYTDDGLPRVQAAVQANQNLKGGKSYLTISNIYHFDPKTEKSPTPRGGYTSINTLLHAR